SVGATRSDRTAGRLHQHCTARSAADRLQTERTGPRVQVQHAGAVGVAEVVQVGEQRLPDAFAGGPGALGRYPEPVSAGPAGHDPGHRRPPRCRSISARCASACSLIRCIQPLPSGFGARVAMASAISEVPTCTASRIGDTPSATTPTIIGTAQSTTMSGPRANAAITPGAIGPNGPGTHGLDQSGGLRYAARSTPAANTGPVTSPSSR